MSKTKKKLKIRNIIFLLFAFIFSGIFIGQGSYLFLIYLFNFKPHAYMLYIFILGTWFMLYLFRGDIASLIYKQIKEKKEKKQIKGKK